MRIDGKTFYDRFGWLLLLVCLMGIPFAFYGAGLAVQSNVNKVEDWLPKTYEETAELAWFRKNFPSDQFIIVSWKGCVLGDTAEEDDPRIAQLAKLVAPDEVDPNDIDAVEAKKYFKSVQTGRMLLDQMTSGRHAMSTQDALERLMGSAIGPDGRQTCVIVSLDPTTTSKMKPILGSGQTRIFRPNVPPGVLRRLLAKVDIPDADLHMGGPPVDNIAIDEEGEKTLVRLAGLSGLLGLGLAWWSLRSVVLTFIVFSCSVTSAAASLAMIWATGETVDAIVLSMPSLVYVLAMSGCVHFINYYKDAVRHGGLKGATERAVLHAIRPAALCSVTTAFGLLSLCASELVPIQKFGFYAAVGVTMLNLIVFLVLPASLHVIGYARRWEGEPTEEERPIDQDTPSEKIWAAISRFIVRNHFGVATACLLFIAFISVGLTKTRSSINLLELFDSQARILQDYRWLEKNLGMLVPLEIVVEFDQESMAAMEGGTAQQDEQLSEEDISKLSFLERIETIARIQDVIKKKFGEEGTQIVGRSISAATFASSLPPNEANIQAYLKRKAYNRAFEGNREELMNTGFLRVDPETGAELWRISLRVAAFQGVDYGVFVQEMRDSLYPIIQAQKDRVRILRQVTAWSGESKLANKVVAIWDPTGEDLSPEEAQKSKLRSEELSNLLTKSRLKVTRVKEPPANLPLVSLQTLNDRVDAVVLAGSFSNAEIGTIDVALKNVIDLQSPDESMTKEWVRPVYTGVVPIVYKAQRALLTSLVESTAWSFLTITPLMILVSRSLIAGTVAMIPNVLPVLAVFGGMGWLGIPVDIGSMMTASIALGVAVDDTIHFLAWFRGDLHKVGDRKKAIVMCYKRCATPTLQAACISGLGLSVFAFSTFTPTQRFGWLMLSILIAGVVSELIMLPALLAGPLGKVFEPGQNRKDIVGRLMIFLRIDAPHGHGSHEHAPKSESVRNKRKDKKNRKSRAA